MQLEKWEDGKLDSDKRDRFNRNVDKMNDAMLEMDRNFAALEKKFHNVVVEASGDDNSEVVGMRTNFNGTYFDSADLRLTATERTIASQLAAQNIEMDVLRADNIEMRQLISALYGATEGNLEIYVDAAKGDDVANDGSFAQPYKTLTKAVAQIPRAINGNSVYITLAPGYYDEDVYIKNKQISAIYIRGSNHETVDPANKQTGVFLRHLNIQDCTGYLFIKGINQLNADKVPEGKGTFMFTRCSYASVGFCRFDDAKAKTNSVPAVVIDGSRGGAHNSYFVNQYAAQVDQYTSHSSFPYTNGGTGNIYAVISNASIIQISGTLNVAATTQKLEQNGGKIF
ncbi:DUF1565 domain-containing protein [Paenilisteria rocourtiae]|uniref:Uncharacterized protein DUF1565 n=1 Tax=Listeria rocourtiae TaxID=647910 RepID=A0A4R6ZNT8_9LIST|nr:DUF1565 domain-containing protein [Listeria rocourtiae]EUJ51789.1 hypothetical protein PROCOU_01412 [Listeria rocourtiae FSL F6-920]TDR54180.1 uncharacterized protein DUF1565 [Listeria rocourtiae]